MTSYKVNCKTVFALALALCASSAMAAQTTIRVSVTIVAPVCVINDNQQINVDFGNDVVTTKVDGSYKKVPITYSVQCQNSPSNNMKLQIMGNGASFDSNVLATNKTGLGIALLMNGGQLPLNSWRDFTYPSLPKLEAVPVKQAGVTLSGGAFSAGATLKVDYQ
ncbi:Minor fimbrial protein prsF precursor [Serratia quinivorans]|nr:Minor fimbrial protein prsF precursor [Serratia quinivorans]CAI1901723.1 Minor fimbrial protein prsF precursor [Serratia quinivorans]